MTILRCSQQRKRIVSSLVLLTLAACSTGKTDNPESGSENVAKPSPQVADALPKELPPGEKEEEEFIPPSVISVDSWAILEEGIWFPVIDETGRYLSAAQENIQSGNAQQAAEDLETVANILANDLEKGSEYLSERRKSTFRASISDVQDIAKRVRSGETLQPQTVNPVLKRAWQANAGKFWVVLSAEEWYPYVQELSRTLKAGRAHFLRKEFEQSGAAFRQAAGFVRMESHRSSEALEDSVRSSARSLEVFAGKIEQERMATVGIKDTDAILIATRMTLARHHLALTKDRLAKGKLKRAGYQLRALALHTERAATLSKKESDASVKNYVKEVKALAEELIAGTTQSQEALMKQVGNLISPKSCCR